MHAFISSRLDCNSLLYGLPNSHLLSLQRIQNSAARLVTRCKRQEHITPILRKLYWLPVQKRIHFKILPMTYKAYNGLAPKYICELISHYPNIHLRSADKLLLKPGPRSKTSFYGDRAFAVAAPKLWNDILYVVHHHWSFTSLNLKLIYLTNLLSVFCCCYFPIALRNFRYFALYKLHYYYYYVIFW